MRRDVPVHQHWEMPVSQAESVSEPSLAFTSACLQDTLTGKMDHCFLWGRDEFDLYENLARTRQAQPQLFPKDF